VQNGKRAKILTFAKSGKSFAIGGVWIQMAKVLVKAHLNLFSPFCHRVFGSKWKKKSKFFAIFFCYLFLLFPFCHRVFGSKWKKKSKFFAIYPFAKGSKQALNPFPSLGLSPPLIFLPWRRRLGERRRHLSRLRPALCRQQASTRYACPFSFLLLCETEHPKP
jgi:hypothetical protein